MITWREKTQSISFMDVHVYVKNVQYLELSAVSLASCFLCMLDNFQLESKSEPI